MVVAYVGAMHNDLEPRPAVNATLRTRAQSTHRRKVRGARHLRAEFVKDAEVCGRWSGTRTSTDRRTKNTLFRPAHASFVLLFPGVRRPFEQGLSRDARDDSRHWQHTGLPAAPKRVFTSSEPRFPATRPADTVSALTAPRSSIPCNRASLGVLASKPPHARTWWPASSRKTRPKMLSECLDRGRLGG